MDKSKIVDRRKTRNQWMNKFLSSLAHCQPCFTHTKPLCPPWRMAFEIGQKLEWTSYRSFTCIMQREKKKKSLRSSFSNSLIDRGVAQHFLTIKKKKNCLLARNPMNYTCESFFIPFLFCFSILLFSSLTPGQGLLPLLQRPVTLPSFIRGRKVFFSFFLLLHRRAG